MEDRMKQKDFDRNQFLQRREKHFQECLLYYKEQRIITSRRSRRRIPVTEDPDKLTSRSEDAFWKIIKNDFEIVTEKLNRPDIQLPHSNKSLSLFRRDNNIYEIMRFIGFFQDNFTQVNFLGAIGFNK